MGVDYGWATLLNLGYELTDACTSIVAATTSGKVFHARNMDFWEGMGFTDTLRNLTYQATWSTGGKVVMQTTQFAGYVGILSGLRPSDGFSITINTRNYPEGIQELFYEVLVALEQKNSNLVSFLSRDTLMTQSSFEAAVAFLSTRPLIADVYYTIAGAESNQGAVISRNRINATDVWRLQPPSQWFLLQTNYDHWGPAPWYDDRVTPGNNNMNAMGQKQLSLDGLMQVLTAKPTMNLQTTYSIVASPQDDSFKTWVRYCQYPCAE